MIGQGKPWSAFINQVDGLPDVSRWSNDIKTADIILIPSADATSQQFKQACQELVKGMDDPSMGPSLDVAVVQIRNNNGSTTCLSTTVPR
jgi:hypothetical protein